MLRVKKLLNVFTLSAVMFSAGSTVATVALSYLPSVIATPGIVAQNVKQSKAEQVFEDEENGFKWELQNCRRTGQKVTCNFLVTNVGQEDRSVHIDTYESRMFDLSGNKYSAKGSQVGNSQLITLIKGIPTKGSIIFELPQEITKVAILEMVLYRITPGSTKLQFRDVNISTSQASNPTNPGNRNCPPQTNQKKPRQR
jgi:hypothetical protein